MRWNATSPHPLAPLSDCLDPPPPPLGLGVALDPPLGAADDPPAGGADDPPLGAGLGLGLAVDPLVVAAVDPLVVAEVDTLVVAAVGLDEAVDSALLSRLLPLQFGQHLLVTSEGCQGVSQNGKQADCALWGFGFSQNGKQGSSLGSEPIPPLLSFISFWFSFHQSKSSQHSFAHFPS